MTVKSEEYRQTRLAIRFAASRALDALDATHAALSRGDVARAREEARQLALAADDTTALFERLTRLVESITDRTE